MNVTVFSNQNFHNTMHVTPLYPVSLVFSFFLFFCPFWGGRTRGNVSVGSQLSQQQIGYL
jgi:hypothetical protein